MDKATAIKTNLFWALQHILCLVHALMNCTVLYVIQFGNVLLVKSTQILTGLAVCSVV